MAEKAVLYQIAPAGTEVPYCPSAQPNMREARLLGVVKNGETSYLAEPVPLTGELLAMTQPVSPSRVLRIAARCEENACMHFDGVVRQAGRRIFLHWLWQKARRVMRT